MSNKNDDEYITEVKGTYDNGKVDLKIIRRKRVVIPAALVLFIMFVIFLVINPAFTLFIVSLPLMLVSLIVLIVGIARDINRKLQYISAGILVVSFILIVIVHLLPTIIIGFVLLVISLITARIYLRWTPLLGQQGG
jgi:asparagine N-glycosylation enzyme membrane subunit Stt3